MGLEQNNKKILRIFFKISFQFLSFLLDTFFINNQVVNLI